MLFILKTPAFILFVFFLLLCEKIFAQPLTYKENAKWGIRENETIIIKPLYDTVFNFEASGKVCLACYKSTTASANKFIKTFTKIYLCNYLDRNSRYLSVKTSATDTCSVFALSKNTVRQFLENPDYFVVSVKTKKHLIDKNFKQITFRGYHEIYFTPVPEFIITQLTNEASAVFTGLINIKEEMVLPYQYSEIKFNTNDSLIIACSAGIRANSEDDVYNYEGKKLGAYHKHVDMATKNFVIHKIFEPKEYYIIYNIATKEEKILNADEVKVFEHDEILVKIKNDWYIYNMLTNQKKPTKQS